MQSPWQLLHRLIKVALLDSKLSDKVLKNLFNCVGNSTVTVEDHAHQKSSPSMDVFEEGAQRECVDWVCTGCCYDREKERGK